MAMSVCSIPLKDRIHRSQNHYKHPLLTSDTLGRPQSYKNYDEEKLSKAYEAVINGMSMRRAAEEHGIPRSTLHDRASG